MKKSTKKKSVQSKTAEIELEFKLTEAQIAAKGIKAAQLSKDQGDLEREFDAIKSEWKEKISDKEAAVAAELAAIRAGKESRKVTCTVERDFEKREVRVIYKGKIHERREMTVNETQMELGTEKKSEAGKGKVDKKLSSAQQDLVDQSLKAPLGSIAAGLARSEADNKKLLEPTVAFEGKPIRTGGAKLHVLDHKRAAANDKDDAIDAEVTDIVRSETNRKTKSSATDGPR